MTKPILLYYAMQRLAKALIFLKNPNADPIALRHHGLSGKGIADESEKFLDNRISNSKTGIFFEFSNKVTNNNILLKKTVFKKRHYKFVETWVTECNIPESVNASTIKIYDLFSLVPELSDLFGSLGIKNELLISCGLDVQENPDNKYDSLLTIDKKLDLDSLRTKFPTIKEYALVGEEHDNYILSLKGRKEVKIPSPLVQADNRDIFLIAANKDSEKISEMNKIKLCFLTIQIWTNNNWRYLTSEHIILLVSSFLLINLIGAILGYWISKTTFIDKLLKKRQNISL